MEPIQLYPSKIKWILLTFGSLVFVALGLWILSIGGPGWIAWSSILFFGACTIVSLLQLLPNAGWLKLDENGFSYRAVFRTRSYRWQEIEGFGAADVSGQRLVIFEAGKTGRVADMNRQLMGADQALPDTYGMSANDLAMLMADYAERVKAKSL